MTDPRGHVRRGEPLAIAATQVNWINDQMRKREITQPPAESLSAPYTWVYGKNNSAYGLSRWAIASITGMEIEPAGGAATTQFCTMPVLSIGTASDPGRRCVALEPIPAGKIGKVAIAGAVQVHAGDVVDLDGVAKLWSDENWALVRFGDPVRLCKTTQAWARNTEATLQIWESGDPPNEQASVGPSSSIQTLVAYNKSYNVAACVWVLVARGTNGKWYLVEAAVPFDSQSCDAPNIGGHDLTTVSGYASNKKQALTHDENACLKWVDIESCET